MFLKGSTASILVPAGSAGCRLRCQMNIPMVAVTSSPNTKVSQAGPACAEEREGPSYPPALPKQLSQWMRPRRHRSQKRLGELPRGGEPVGWNRRQGGEHHPLELLRDGRTQATQTGDLTAQPLGHDRLWGGSAERGFAGQHLVEHDAKAVHVCASVNIPLPHSLFRAHVSRRAECETRLGDSIVGRRRIDRSADAKIGDESLVIDEKDVLRLHVAVDDPLPVGEVEREGHLARHPNRFLDGKLALALQSVTQALALDVRHSEPQTGRPLTGAHLAGVMDRDDVGMLQPGCELDLAEETISAEGLG